jgi:hypothetical protein
MNTYAGKFNNLDKMETFFRKAQTTDSDSTENRKLQGTSFEISPTLGAPLSHFTLIYLNKLSHLTKKPEK